MAVLLLLCAPALLLPALTAVQGHEFTLYRMQQYNLQQQKHGCRGALVVAEARTVEERVLTRRCVVMRLADFTLDRYQDALRHNAASVLILVPQNISSVPQDVIQRFMVSEAEVVMNDTLMPVYAAMEEEELLSMYEEMKAASLALQSSSPLQVLSSMVTANGFQIFVGSDFPIKPISDTAFITLEGVLFGTGEDLPTVVITAHYDSFGIAPWLSYGADSNASGVAVLLELVRLFHRLYSDAHSQARYNILFSLTGGGKYNYQGTKRWIEENLDHTESSLLHENVAFVLCLDTLANGEGLYLHVSRPPKPGTIQHAFIQELDQVISSRFPSVKFGIVHKKINLGERALSWEHERYGMRRIPAFTLSHLEDPRSGLRGSILDTVTQTDMKKLRRNAVIIAESMARFMYNLTKKGSPKELPVFRGHMEGLCLCPLQEVQESRLSSLMSYLSSVPRASQLLDREPSLQLLISTLEHEFSQYLQHVQRHVFRTDRRDPEVVFFDQMKQTMMMHRVKPAVFDLFLGACIAAYLGVVYYAIQNLGHIYMKITKMAMNPKQQ
nr:PREDICTED: nicalin-1-like isoform X1 [Lepisosteus oculatus]XP_015217082.1 PREDICTED: nicalin-1-like isoform X1 [Lepisosteus oculatus]